MRTKVLPLLLLTITISIFSCTRKAYTNYGSKVVLNKNTPKYPDAYIQYQSSLFLLEKAKDEAKVQMWDSARLQERISNIPKGGYIILKTISITQGAAKTNYFEILVTDSAGNKILREKGSENSVPDSTYSSTLNTLTWSDTDFFRVDTPMNAPFKVFVFNTLSNTRGEFDIYPNIE